MANIDMDYIMIKKDNNNTQPLDQILLKCLEKSGFTRGEGCFFVDEDDVIEYEIKNIPNSNRTIVRFHSSMRFNKGIKSLQLLDDLIFRDTDYQKYVNAIRDYDGVSATLSEKLYPKYAQYERKLRQFVLLVLTKSFGNSWRNETIPKEKMDDLKKRSKGGNVSLNDTLELFDLQQMEDYLFKPREVNYPVYLEDNLSKNQINLLSKEEIIRIVDGMRPRSLWERCFNDIGDGCMWEKQIKEIHECRNKVAHHKHISVDEYKLTNTRLDHINEQLLKCIEEIYRKEFTSINAIDLLGSFALFINSIKESIAKTVFSGLLNQINKSIQQMVEPIKKSNLNIVDTFKQVKERMELLSQPIFDEDISEKRKLLSQTYQNINDDYIKKQMEIEAIEIADRVGEMVKDSE